MDGSNGLGKLLPKAINAKRKSRKQKLAREAEADDDTDSRRPSSATTKSADWRIRPTDSEADDGGDDGRSFASYESSPSAGDSADP